MTPTEIKMECLRLASIRQPNDSDVLELAKTFEQYVTGDDAKFVSEPPLTEPQADVLPPTHPYPNGDPNIYADT